jgi:hypothetical protein
VKEPLLVLVVLGEEQQQVLEAPGELVLVVVATEQEVGMALVI